MDRARIGKLVNLWDPFGLFELSPDGEYSDIINEVERLLKSGKDKNTLYVSLREFLTTQFNDVDYSDKKLKEFIESLLTK